MQSNQQDLFALWDSHNTGTVQQQQNAVTDPFAKPPVSEGGKNKTLNAGGVEGLSLLDAEKWANDDNDDLGFSSSPIQPSQQHGAKLKSLPTHTPTASPTNTLPPQPTYTDVVDGVFGAKNTQTRVDQFSGLILFADNELDLLAGKPAAPPPPPQKPPTTTPARQESSPSPPSVQPTTKPAPPPPAPTTTTSGSRLAEKKTDTKNTTAPAPEKKVHRKRSDAAASSSAQKKIDRTESDGIVKVEIEEEFLGARPRAPVDDPSELEECEKKTVYVVHKNQRTPVSWFSDTPNSDVREAILCACDAIFDAGFTLRELVPLDGSGGAGGAATKGGDDFDFLANMQPVEQPSLQEKAGAVTDEHLQKTYSKGRVHHFKDFGSLGHGKTYLLEPAGLLQGENEQASVKKVTGDKQRRLLVCIDPLLHVEVSKALQRMKKGSNLLKHTRYGFPHLRQFQLSQDNKRLVWYSGAKSKTDSMVPMEDVVEIRLGQTSPNFTNYKLPMLEHLSFSIVYKPKPLSAFTSMVAGLVQGGSGVEKDGNKYLDLTCKDEFEFDLWVTGLKALVLSAKGKTVNKAQLLGHSRRFKKALESSNFSVRLTDLPEVKEQGQVGLDDCIELKTHTAEELEAKLDKLNERLKTMSKEMSKIDRHSSASADMEQPELDVSLLLGSGPAYAAAFEDGAKAEDEDMEVARMFDLEQQVAQMLQQARTELIALGCHGLIAQSSAAIAANPALKNMTAISMQAATGAGRYKDKKEEKEREKEREGGDATPASLKDRIMGFGSDSLSSSASDAKSSETKTDKNKLSRGRSTDDALGSSGSGVRSESKERKKKSDAKKLRIVEQLLWKAEVDIENIEDLYARHVDNANETTSTITKSLADANATVSASLEEFGESVKETWNSWFARPSAQSETTYDPNRKY